MQGHDLIPNPTAPNRTGPLPNRTAPNRTAPEPDRDGMADPAPNRASPEPDRSRTGGDPNGPQPLGVKFELVRLSVVS